VVRRELAPLQDAQRALRIIRGNALRWGVRAGSIGALGSSAGGHLAATLGTLLDDVSGAGDSLDRLSATPDFLILVSPVITMGAQTHAGSRDNLLGPAPPAELVRRYSCELQVTPSTPAAFIVHALNDRTVPVQNSVMFAQSCLENSVPASLHLFPGGGHSIGLRDNPGSTALWPSLCELWLRESGFLPEPRPHP
jgi:acetyl esterase/lipase